MKQLKPITTALQNLGVPALVVLIIVLVALIIGAYLLWKNKAKKPESKEAKEPEVAEEKPKALKKTELYRVWQNLLDQHRTEFKHAIPTFKPVVFMGSPAVDSQRLISAYSDWRALENQDRHSETKHPDLHIYVGAIEVVQDIRPHIMEDGSSQTHDALEYLWERTHKQHDAIAVASLSWGKLEQAQESIIKQWANQTRGKVNLLSISSGKKRADVRVLVSDLGAVPGYEAFAKFAAKHGVKLTFTPKQYDGDPLKQYSEEALRAAFLEVADYAELALTTSSAEEYREVLAFLDEIPKRLDKLSVFLKTLFAQGDALSESPELSSIHFHNDYGSSSNPLAVDPPETSTIRPYRRIKVIAAAAAALLAIICFVLFSRERQLWLDADEAARHYQVQEKTVLLAEGTDKQERHREFNEDDEATQNRDVVRTFVEGDFVSLSFYDNAVPDIQDRFASQVRETAFRGLIDETIRKHSLPHQRVLYLLTLMHACQGNDEIPSNSLAEYAVNRTDTWSVELNLPEELLDEYLLWSRTGQVEAVPLNGLTDVGSSGKRTEQLWYDYFSALQNVTNTRVIDSSSLNQLRKTSKKLTTMLQQSDRFPESLELIEELKYSRSCSSRDKFRSEPSSSDQASDAASGTGERRVLPLSPWWPQYEDKFVGLQPVLKFQDRLREKSGHLKQVLNLVRQTSLSPAEDQAVQAGEVGTLKNLVHTLKEIERGVLLPDEIPEIIREEGQWYDFDAISWYAAIKQNGYLYAVEKFLEATPDANPETIFFGAADKRELGRCHVMLNPGARGEDFFTGKVDFGCEYTLTGLNDYVIPLLKELVSLEIAAGTANKHNEVLYGRLKAHLLRALERYTDTYRGHWLSYFERFGMRASSVEQLLILLRRLESPTSPLQAVMDKLLLNVRVVSPQELQVFIDPLQDELHKEFEPLINLEMKDYQGFVTTLRETLEAAGEAPAAEEGADGGGTSALESTETLEAALRPEGRLALATLIGGAGSQRALVRKWLREKNITRYGNNPFDDPFIDADRLGIKNLRTTLREAWRNSFEAEVAPVFQKFPFNTGVSTEVEPTELDRLFKPETGLFFSLVQRYIMPVSKKDDTRGYGPYNDAVARAKLIPDKVYTTINNVQALSKTLWDDKGTPLNYAIAFYGEPLPVGDRTRAVLSLAYLREGDRSLVNFNQAKVAVRKVLEIDWNTPSAAQVGLRMTDVESKEDTYPRALSSEKKYWSLLHLLRRRHKLTAAENTKLARLPRGHKRYAFRFVLGSAQGGGSLTVSFVAERDPFLVFRRLAYSGSTWP